MLRARYPETVSTLPMPVQGVNLRDPAHTLNAGECRLLQNGYYDGAIQPILGTRAITPSSLSASARVRGGHRFYKQDGSAYRLIAYGTRISTVSNAGSESVLTTAASSDKTTWFTTWPILNRCYAVNGSDNPYYFDGSSFGQLTGTNIPTAKSKLVPVLDRLMCVTTNGVERTDARTDATWSSNSAWATLRPQRPGLFTALHPISMRGTDAIYPGALAFQANAYYLITGTDYGDSVIAATASTTEDSSIQLLDGMVGTSSPNSICTVPGVGIFWVTSDLNVYFLPEGQLYGFYIGDKLQSRCSTKGLNDANLGALDQIWSAYFDRKLLIAFPTGTSTYPDTQYWLDLRYLTAKDNTGAVWYGPMTVNTWGCAWREDQSGELALYAGEGNSATGVFVYNAFQAGTVGHTIGTTTTLPTMLYQDRNLGSIGGIPLKYPQDARMTLTKSGGNARAGIVDLGDNLTYRQAVSAWNG